MARRPCAPPTLRAAPALVPISVRARPTAARAAPHAAPRSSADLESACSAALEEIPIVEAPARTSRTIPSAVEPATKPAHRAKSAATEGAPHRVLGAKPTAAARA